MRRGGSGLRGPRVWLGVWVVLLGASYLVRWAHPEAPLPEGMFETRVAGRRGTEVVRLAAATLVSEDLTCIGAGLLVAQGRIGLAAAVVACMVGILVGDLLQFAAGRWLGRPWLRRPPLKWLVSSDRVEAASRWAEELALPVVLKPDAGERGKGVRVVRSRAELEEHLDATPEACMVQEYVDGPELGIFYVRRPGEQSGGIFSVTDKRLPEVTGDGRSSLERLILGDRRWVCMAPTFLRRWAARLAEVPPTGERILLGDLGTHCRGALFLDGRELATPALEQAVERIARSYDGFYFGRFDFRAPSREAFAEGRGLRVLELNGVTSEATHIYDPSTRLFEAYRVLLRQWSLAFEIGRANRDRGAEVTRVGRLLGAILSWR